MSDNTIDIYGGGTLPHVVELNGEYLRAIGVVEEEVNRQNR